jgi:hypothetical protein
LLTNQPANPPRIWIPTPFLSKPLSKPPSKPPVMTMAPQKSFHSP